jgi:hypothetical protein
MRIFKNPWFTRFAAKEGIADQELKDMVNQLEAGQADADLGGGVYRYGQPVRGLEKPGDTGLSCFLGAGSGLFMCTDLRSRYRPILAGKT